ncbi:hypothetical protein [Pseudogemmobacter bohemicus]|uniref:hypothetical protein n=1 Tax=Pseudogemmobacter bohemicus TaxID=2250708 RepID=UPI00130019E6|nr:hypothetical protein [Pseudogemmobacter bohemicus]
MPKKLFLHIGRAKTGTSALQFQLRLMRRTLAAQGILYPSTGFRRVSQGGIALACHQNSASSDADLTALREKFEAEILPFDRIIVSSEGFQNITTRNRPDYFFRRNQQDFYDISVLCVVREFLACAMSAYSQRVQITGMVSTPEQFCSWFAKFSLPGFFDFWSAFGDRAIFIGYEAEIAAHGSLLPRFAQEMEVDLLCHTGAEMVLKPLHQWQSADVQAVGEFDRRTSGGIQSGFAAARRAETALCGAVSYRRRNGGAAACGRWRL